MSTKIVAALVCILSVGHVCADSFSEELDKKREQLSGFREDVLNQKVGTVHDLNVEKACGCGSTSSCTS